MNSARSMWESGLFHRLVPFCCFAEKSYQTLFVESVVTWRVYLAGLALAFLIVSLLPTRLFKPLRFHIVLSSSIFALLLLAIHGFINPGSKQSAVWVLPELTLSLMFAASQTSGTLFYNKS